MISRVHSSILQGIDAIAGEVEVDVARGGMGEFKLVGLAETAVKESVSRIQAAVRNSGYRWPGPTVKAIATGALPAKIGFAGHGPAATAKSRG